MKPSNINHVACWIAILAICAFLYTWHNFIFFDAWLDHNNLTAGEFEAKRGFFPYAISLISTVLIVYLFAWLFEGLEVDDFQSGIGVAMSIGFALTFLNVLGRDMYLYRPLEITFIDGGASLIACFIAGVILGIARQRQAETG